jgi:isoleucyl-tRNA synthetase
LLFAKEKFTHSYPHCWRCDTPLLNYATSSWFVKVTDFRDKLVSANQQVNWVPEHVRDGRFGKWLEGARDWAISRSRFWGAPLPVWRCADCGAIKVFGSFDELAKEQKQSGNKYWVMRHGDAEANADNGISADPNESNHLTAKGKNEIKVSVQKLKESKIDLIISSDFVRTKETAEMIAQELGLDPKQIILDERLREINPGNFIGKTWFDYNDSFGERINRLTAHPDHGGENYNDVRKRTMAVLYEADQKYQDKNILIVTHGLPAFMIQATIGRWGERATTYRPYPKSSFETGEVRAIDFVPLPHNRNYELDVHRPFIDEVEFPCACGSNFKRVPEVFDCWYESGSMPYAQDHYPFNANSPIDPVKKIGFPANFISEGLDQTRGWFYSLIVLGVALFGESPYQNVATNGLVLAEDGQKMSKHLLNYPDPLDLADRLGADPLRLYLMSSPAVRGEDLNFSEKGVAEIGRRIVARLLNVLSFYQMYVEGIEERPRAHLRTHLDGNNTKNILDQWILARLNETIKQTTEALERYEIDRSVAPIDNFIDDLSTWYLRRSRDRFKIEGVDRDEAIATIHFVLLATAKLLAPVAPFVAEMIYRELKTEADPESVHLASWPNPVGEIDDDLLADMQKTRDVVSLGLEFRQAAKIKVRQPLAELIIKDNYLADKSAYLELVKDELNVKAINFKAEIEDAVWLDTNLTAELQEEGMVRELIRQIQEKRKTAGLAPGEKIDLTIDTDGEGQEFLRRFETELKLGTTTQKLEYATIAEGEEVWAGERPFKVKIIKL